MRDVFPASCHVFVEKALAIILQVVANISQMCRLVKGGVAAKIDMASIARPWTNASKKSAEDWGFQQTLPGLGVLVDASDHLINTLLSTAEQKRYAFLIYGNHASTLHLLTAVSLYQRDGTPAMSSARCVGSSVPDRASFFWTVVVHECHQLPIGNQWGRRLGVGPGPRRTRARTYRKKFGFRNRPRSPTLLPCQESTREGPVI